MVANIVKENVGIVWFHSPCYLLLGTSNYCCIDILEIFVGSLSCTLTFVQVQVYFDRVEKKIIIIDIVRSPLLCSYLY